MLAASTSIKLFQALASPLKTFHSEFCDLMGGASFPAVYLRNKGEGGGPLSDF